MYKLLMVLALAGAAFGQITPPPGDPLPTILARHVGFGVALPAKCSPSTGDIYFLTVATVGMYQCLSTDTWTIFATGGGGSPTGAAGGDLSGTYPNPAVAKINNTSVPTNSAADQFLGTTASATAAWASITNCIDSGGNHLNYTVSSHAFSCGTSSSGGGAVSSVFTRTGAVVANTGDYTAAQVTNAARTDVGNTFTGHQTIEGVTSTGATGTGKFVFDTSPLLVTPKATTINDANGNPFLLSSATASAVDSVTVTNAATANPATVTVGATGSDSNINLSLVGKGTGAVQAPNGISFGPSPPSVTAGTAGVQGWKEGTVPTVCAATGVDCIYSDATQHGFLASYNNGSYLPLVQGPASSTNGRFAIWASTNGGLLADHLFAASDLPNAGVFTGDAATTFPALTIANNAITAVKMVNAGVFTGDATSTFPAITIGNLAITNAKIANSTIDLTAKVTGVLPAANVDTSITRTIASGTSALGTSAIASAACATVVTTSATGTAATDTITWVPNADISGVTGYGVATTDGLKVYPYPTTNNVNWRVCNGTGTSITPGAVTLNWRVVR